MTTSRPTNSYSSKIARAFGLTNPDVIAEYVAIVEDAAAAGRSFVTLHHGANSIVLNTARPYPFVGVN